MKKDDLISDDFFEQFKTHEELTGFSGRYRSVGSKRCSMNEWAKFNTFGNPTQTKTQYRLRSSFLPNFHHY